MKNYSQLDEQNRLIKIFDFIGIKYYRSLEFGAMSYHTSSNTIYFVIEKKFEGIFWDGTENERFGISKEFVTVENFNELYKKYGLNKGCDLLSIDIDGVDYWVWKALKYKPRMVIIEYNSQTPKGKSVTVKYHPKFTFDRTTYYGASWNALLKLGKSKGYTLVDSTALNMIFVLNSEITSKFPYGNLSQQVHRGWPEDRLKREWIEV